MRVPGFEGLSGQDTAALQPQPMQVSADHSVAEGLGQMGQAVGGAAKAYDEAQRKAAEQAKQLRLAQALTDLERATNDELVGRTARGSIDAAFEGDSSARRQGYFETRGEEAFAQSAPTLERLRKAQQKITDVLPSELQGEFSRRADQAIEDAHRRIEMHAGQQWAVVQKQTLEDAKLQGLRSLDASERRGEGEAGRITFARIDAQVEALIRAQAVSPAAAEEDVRQWRASAAITRIKARVDGEDLDGARQLYAVAGDLFDPPQREAIDRELDRLEQTKAKKAALRDADEEVSKLVEQATGGGLMWPKAEAMLRNELRQMPVDDPRYKILSKRLHDLGEEFKVSEHMAMRDARLASEAGGEDTAATVRLQQTKEGAEYLARLRNDREVRARRLQAMRKGGHGGGAAARREQREANQLALLKFKALGLQGMAEASIDDFSAGMTVDELGYAQLEAAQAAAKDRMNTTAGRQFDSFMNEAERQGLATFNAGKKGAKKMGAPPEAYRAWAAELYDQKEQELKRPLNQKERDEILAELTAKNVSGALWWRTTKWGFEEKGAAPETPPREAPFRQPKPDERVRVKLKASGKTGTVLLKEFNPVTMERL